MFLPIRPFGINTHLLIFLFLLGGVANETMGASRDYRPHEGYLGSVEREHEISYKDLMLMAKPVDDHPSLQDLIFNEDLSREFRERYREKFGQIEVERVVEANKYTYYDSALGFRGTVQEMDEQRAKFGEYMLLRLIEYHFDGFAKTDPQIRPIWLAKERLSRMQIEINKIRFDLAYSLPDNTLDLKLVSNRFANSKLRFQMNREFSGSEPLHEVILFMHEDVDIDFGIGKLSSMDQQYLLIERKAILDFKNSVSPSLSTTMRISVVTGDSDRSRRETLYLAGLSFAF